MSVRSISFVRNAFQRQSRTLTSRVTPLHIYQRTTTKLWTSNTTTKYPSALSGNRFYASSSSMGKQTQKLSTMATSPELLKTAAKVEQKPSKLKELTRKYGAAGIVVYIVVGCADLAVTLGVIELVGLEKVKALEESVLDVVYRTGEKFGIKKKETPLVVDSITSTETTAELVPAENDTPSFASVFILAYGIHKTLMLPVRIGITAAITPAIVRKLHQMGWARYFPKLLAASVPKKP